MSRPSAVKSGWTARPQPAAAGTLERESGCAGVRVEGVSATWRGEGRETGQKPTDREGVEL